MRRFFAALGILAAMGGGISAAQAASRPLLLLFPPPQASRADFHALADLRTQLEAGKRLDLLTFDPNSPSVILAATQDKHPEWLTAPVSSNSERLEITQAVNAQFAAVVTAEGQGRVDVDLLDTDPALHSWAYTRFPIKDAAAAIQTDMLTPLPPPPAPAAPPSAPPVLTPPAAATPAPAPPQVDVNLDNPPAAPQPSQPPAPEPIPQVPENETPSSVSLSPAATGLAAIQPLIAAGDEDVAEGDVVDAYVLYQKAINQDPLSDVPRLKLAQAYLLGGETDLALSEAQRALEVIPHSVAIQEFLAKYDSDSNSSAGNVARYQAIVLNNPQDASACLDLGDAFWSNGDNVDAAKEYEKARELSAPSSLTQQIAIAHLARLHTDTDNYTQALSEMQKAGGLAYPLVISVVQSKMDNLIQQMSQAQSDFGNSKITRAQLYGEVQQAGASAQALATFVGKITPPAAYFASHLERVQAVNLLSQAAAVLATYLETNDQEQQEKFIQLEKDAQAEMLTAHAAEVKLGLWNDNTQTGEQEN